MRTSKHLSGHECRSSGGRIQQLLLATLVVIAQVSATGHATDLSSGPQEPFQNGMRAAQQQDWSSAIRYFIEAQQSDTEAPVIWFNLGLASSKVPNYELRALACFQLYLLKARDAPNAEAVRRQISALEIAFDSRITQILDKLEPLIATDKSNDSLFAGLNIAYARSYLGDFAGGLRALRTTTGISNWQDAATQYKDETNAYSDYGRMLEWIRLGRTAYLRNVGIGIDVGFGQGYIDVSLSDELRASSDSSKYTPQEALNRMTILINHLSANYRAIDGVFDPGRKPDAYWVTHYANAYATYGRAYLGSKDYDRAIEAYNNAIELNPKFAGPYIDRGVAYHYLNNITKEIADYSKAIELDPSAQAYNNRGTVYFDLRDYAKAIEDYRIALKLDPNYSSAASNLDLALKVRSASPNGSASK
jgi:tetratricopeptide (TPR) repeat protein